LSKNKTRGALKGIRRSPKPHPIHETFFLQPHILELKRSFPPLDAAINEEDRKVVRAQTRNPLLEEPMISSFPIRRNKKHVKPRPRGVIGPRERPSYKEKVRETLL
jgi:hypothetical protein